VLHLFLYGLLAILLAGGLFLLASWLLPAGEQIAPPVRDDPPWEMQAERALAADDIDGVRLPVALRGYRFAETDLLLDRLAAELRARDAEIARLRGDEPASVDEAVPVEEAVPVDEAAPVEAPAESYAPLAEDAPVSKHEQPAEDAAVE